MKRNVISLLMAATLVLCSFGGCGSTPSSSGDDSSSTASADEPLHVVVAGTPGYTPYTFVGDDGEETGFDIEVLRAIDEIAPEIECEFQYSEWDTLMPGLDAGRFDIVCNQLGKTEERESMYLFEDLPYSYTGGMIITNEKYKDGTGWESLKGATVECITGSNYTTVVEDYLAENPGAFNITYTEGSLAQVLTDIANGTADATLEDPAVARANAESAGLSDSIYVIEHTYDPFLTYYMFAKTDRGQEIASIIDKYLPVLYYNGTLSELANEWIGSDTCITSLPEQGYFTESTLEEYQAAHTQQ